MITKERAAEIVAQSKEKARFGPWVDQLDKVMTAEERKEITDHWNTMDGSTCFVDALMQFVAGKVKFGPCDACGRNACSTDQMICNLCKKK